MTVFHYDREGKVISRERFFELARDDDYTRLHYTVRAGCQIVRMWRGRAQTPISVNLDRLLADVPNPSPMVSATQISPPVLHSMMDWMYGIYLQKFWRESQALEQHRRAELWLKRQLEL